MSTEVILNLIVGMVALNSLAAARYNVDARRIKAADYGPSYIFTTLITGVGAVTLWTWLAYETGHWQFVAIIGVPMLITVGSLAARPKQVAR